MNEAYEVLSKGGPVMVPIVLCSVVALTIFLERLWTLQRPRVLPTQFLDRLFTLLREKKFDSAAALCSGSNSTIARVAASGLRKAGHSRSVVRHAFEEAGRRETSYMERFVGALGAIASVAPLLGLLGTVTGMIKVFGQVGQEFDKGGEVNAGMLANGIWEALITTAAGLTVAIPVFLLFRFLMARIDGYVVELETYSSDMVDLIAPSSEVDAEDDDEDEDAPARSKKSAAKSKKTTKGKKKSSLTLANDDDLTPEEGSESEDSDDEDSDDEDSDDEDSDDEDSDDLTADEDSEGNRPGKNKKGTKKQARAK